MKNTITFRSLFLALAGLLIVNTQLFAQLPWFTGTTSLTTATRYMEAVDMISSGGSMFTAGTRTNVNGTYDLIVAKYNTSGILQASVTRNLANFDEVPVKIKSDASGNIYVLSTANASATNTDLWLVKYNASLVFQWSVTLAATSTSNEKAVDMAVSGSSVYIIGNTVSTASGSNILLARYTTAGILSNQTNFQFAATANDEVATGAHFDGTSLFVTGYYNNGSNLDGIVLKYSSILGLSYSTAWSPSATAATNDAFNAIVGDATSLYVAGYTTSGTIPTKDMVVVKFSKSTGAFSNQSIRSTTSNEEFTHIVMNNTDLYALGNVAKSGNKNYVLVHKYTNTLAVAAAPWPRTYNPGSDSYMGYDLEVKSSGAVLVVGTVFKTSTSGINYTASMALMYNATGTTLQEYVCSNNVGCNTLETSAKAGLFYGSYDSDIAICGGHMAWSSTIANSKANRIEIWGTLITPTEPGDDTPAQSTQRVLQSDNKEVVYTLFPNPVSSELQVSGEEMAAEVMIFDLNGRLVRQLTAGAASFSVDVNDLQPGQYVIRINGEQGQSSQNFVKM